MGEQLCVTCNKRIMVPSEDFCLIVLTDTFLNFFFILLVDISLSDKSLYFQILFKGVIFLQEFSLYPNPGQAGVKRSDDVGQGHLSISHYKGFKFRDPLVIDRAGHTSREELLKVREGLAASLCKSLQEDILWHFL